MRVKVQAELYAPEFLTTSSVRHSQTFVTTCTDYNS